MISGGRLRWTATIKRENNTDTLGKKERSFTTTVGTFRCDLRDIGSAEIGYSDGIAATNTWEVHARWQAIEAEGLLETDKLVIDGKTMSIVGIRNEFNRDRLAVITCVEVR
jgi:hypothetical protein